MPALPGIEGTLWQYLPWIATANLLLTVLLIVGLGWWLYRTNETAKMVLFFAWLLGATLFGLIVIASFLVFVFRTF